MIRTFTVIDKQTGQEPDTRKICLNEDWAKSLIYCDVDGFFINESGNLFLADDCGNIVACPQDRFTIIWNDTEE